jgi:hypothetical protein
MPITLNKTSINYEDFILTLSKKANLNKVYKAEIESSGVELFDKKTENKIMGLDSVK